MAVYFRHERLATGVGHSIQQAEMAAATNALMERSGNIKKYMYSLKLESINQIVALQSKLLSVTFDLIYLYFL